MDVLQEFMASEIPKASSKGRTGRKHRRGSRNSRVSVSVSLLLIVGLMWLSFLIPCGYWS